MYPGIFDSEAVIVHGSAGFETVTIQGSSVNGFPQVSPYAQARWQPEMNLQVNKSVYEKLTPGPADKQVIMIGLTYGIATNVSSQLSGW